MAGKVEEEAQKQKEQKQAKPQRPKHEYDDYAYFLHKKRVELHINYGGSILKLTGILRAKAKYDYQLIIENDDGRKEILTINKAYVVMIKPA